MGMFNEVSKDCPRCEKSVIIQIPQVVLGFGGFNLDRPSTTEDLTRDEKEHLKRILKDETFQCDCGHSFSVDVSVVRDIDVVKVEI